MSRLHLVSLLMLVLSFAAPALAAQRSSTMAGRSAVYAPNGMRATSQPLATTAALSVLQQAATRSTRR